MYSVVYGINTEPAIEVYTPIPGVWSGSIPASTAGLVPLQTPLVGTGTNPAVLAGMDPLHTPGMGV